MKRQAGIKGRPYVSKSNQTESESPSASVADASSLVQRIVDLIREQGLEVGDRLPNIRLLATTFGVKPTEVRDALLQAQFMGLVRILPRSGAYVQSVNFGSFFGAVNTAISPALFQQDHNLLQLLDARRFLEVELAGRAAERRRMEDLLPVRRALESMSKIPQTQRRLEYVEADIAFHIAIAQLAGNSLLQTFHQATLNLLKPYLIQLPWAQTRRERTDKSHAAIYKALAAGNSEATRAAMHEHLTLAYENLLREVESPP